MDAKFLEEGQLLDQVEDENDNDGNADDLELEGIDVSKWDKRNGRWLVPEEHRLGVLRQPHDSQVTGHWEDTELSSWSHVTSHWTYGQKMWQTMLQDA